MSENTEVNQQMYRSSRNVPSKDQSLYRAGVVNHVPIFLDVTEFCAMVKRSPHTAQRWRSQQYGPAPIKQGGRVLYRLTDVIDWLESLKSEGAGFHRAEVPQEDVEVPSIATKDEWWKDRVTS